MAYIILNVLGTGESPALQIQVEIVDTQGDCLNTRLV